MYKFGKKDFVFKVGISDERGWSFMLCIANDSFASSDWALKDGDVISVLRYGSTLKFAVNDKEYPKIFDNLSRDRIYRLTVLLYECMEIQIL